MSGQVFLPEPLEPSGGADQRAAAAGAYPPAGTYPPAGYGPAPTPYPGGYADAATRPARLGGEDFVGFGYRPPALPTYAPVSSRRKGSGVTKVAAMAVATLIPATWFFGTDVMAATGIDVINREYHGAPVDYAETAPPGFVLKTVGGANVSYTVPDTWTDVTLEYGIGSAGAPVLVDGVPVQFDAWEPDHAGFYADQLVLVGSVSRQAVWPAVLDASHEDAVEALAESVAGQSAPGGETSIVVTGEGLSARHATIAVVEQGVNLEIDVWTMARGDVIVLVAGVSVAGGASDAAEVVDSLRIDG